MNLALTKPSADRHPGPVNLLVLIAIQSPRRIKTNCKLRRTKFTNVEVETLNSGLHKRIYRNFRYPVPGLIGVGIVRLRCNLFQVARFDESLLGLDLLRFFATTDEPKYDSEGQGRASQCCNQARGGLVEIKNDESANQC